MVQKLPGVMEALGVVHISFILEKRFYSLFEFLGFFKDFFEFQEATEFELELQDCFLRGTFCDLLELVLMDW